MAEKKILPYLDIPFQHASPSVLKAMKRPANDQKVLDRIQRWRKEVPELTLRSTFIVGFPGETEQDFDYLLQWLEEADLDRVGCFKYEPVEGAAANALPGAVPEEVKEERWHRFMQAQQLISARRLAAKVGRTMQVLVDEITPRGAICRSHADAPEIDGTVIVRGAKTLRSGDLVNVIVEEADAYDLFARRLA